MARKFDPLISGIELRLLLFLCVGRPTTRGSMHVDVDSLVVQVCILSKVLAHQIYSYSKRRHSLMDLVNAGKLVRTWKLSCSCTWNVTTFD